MDGHGGWLPPACFWLLQIQLKDDTGSSGSTLGKLWTIHPIQGPIALSSQAWVQVMLNKLLGFLDYELTTAKKQAKREAFLAALEEGCPDRR